MARALPVPSRRWSPGEVRARAARERRGACRRSAAACDLGRGLSAGQHLRCPARRTRAPLGGGWKGGQRGRRHSLCPAPWAYRERRALRTLRGPHSGPGHGAPRAGRPPGALWLFALGLWSLEVCLAIARAGRFCVSRWQPHIPLRGQDRLGPGGPLTLEPFLQRVPRQGRCALTVRLGPKHQFPWRRLCSPGPPAVANARRLRVQHHAPQKGRPLSQRTWARRSCR
jgi:hypothetical protein